MPKPPEDIPAAPPPRRAVEATNVQAQPSSPVPKPPRQKKPGRRLREERARRIFDVGAQLYAGWLVRSNAKATMENAVWFVRAAAKMLAEAEKQAAELPR